MKKIYYPNGISLIALIITIIVIIILAAIVIFSGLNTPDRANLAKFVQEISDLRLAVQQDFLSKKAEYATSGKTRSDAQIYYTIAQGEEIDMNVLTEPAGYVSELGLDLEGDEYYELTDDRNVKNWNSNKGYAEPRYSAESGAGTEHHYITDKGEVFILPGYLTEEGDTKRFFVSEKASYISEDGTPLREAELAPLSDTYQIGQYVDYKPAPASGSVPYTSNVEGVHTTDLSPDMTAPWRIVYLDEAKRKIWITPGIVNYATSFSETVLLSAVKGYYNGPAEIENICKSLYSNTIKGIIAHSATIEDVNTICGQTPPAADYYAFYPNGTALEDTVNQTEVREGQIKILDNATQITIEENGVQTTYTKIEHSSVGVMDNEPVYRFWIGNGAKIDCLEEAKTSSIYGKQYYSPSATHPVYVKQTYYNYNYPTEEGNNIKAIINPSNAGTIYAWLPSPCVRFSDNQAHFRLFSASASSIGAGYLGGSQGQDAGMYRGLLPIVTLNVRLLNGEGSGTEGDAWQLK